MKTNQGGTVRMVAKEYTMAFVLVTSLFLLWGGARAILDVLNKHFQDTLDVSKAQSAMVQMAVYMAYFIGAYPAGMLIRKYGTRKGVITGLCLFAAGSFLFIPISGLSQFACFLIPLFILGCGLVLLETAANPYVTLLGDPRTSAGRLNLSQSFNGLGCILGVLLGGALLLDEGAEANVATPYAIIGGIVVVVALLFTQVKLPEVVTEHPDHSEDDEKKPLGMVFWFGFAALLSYEISEISINTFFINFMCDDGFMTKGEAAKVLSICGLGLFMLGRVIGSLFMQRIATEKIMLVCALGTVATVGMALCPFGAASKYSLILCYAFESIMFPTIFALAIRGQKGNTERASSILMMTVVGGAIGPLALGYVADNFGTTAGFAIPFATFLVVLAFALYSLMHMRKH
mgnify:FL=1